MRSWRNTGRRCRRLLVVYLLLHMRAMYVMSNHKCLIQLIIIFNRILVRAFPTLSPLTASLFCNMWSKLFARHPLNNEPPCKQTNWKLNKVSGISNALLDRLTNPKIWRKFISNRFLYSWVAVCNSGAVFLLHRTYFHLGQYNATGQYGYFGNHLTCQLANLLYVSKAFLKIVEVGWSDALYKFNMELVCSVKRLYD